MNILGIDIGKGTATCCLISSDHPPEKPSEFLQSRSNFLYFKGEVSERDKKEGWESYRKFAELKPDVAVLEPTGTNYSRLWVEMLKNQGVTVLMVDHGSLANFRADVGLRDKTDEADCLALAIYAQRYQDDRRRFVIVRPAEIQKIREIVLRLEHLNRVKSPVINRLRQDLEWQCPEIAGQKFHRSVCSPTVPIFLRFLAGESESKRYRKIVEESLGLGIQDSVKQHAQRLIAVEMEEILLEQDLKQAINNPKFSAYLKVFNKFHFNFRMQGILLSQVYPLESFLDEDGKPIEVFRRSSPQSKRKFTKRKLSLRRFEKMVGLAPTEATSGKKKSKKIMGGSGLCRKTFFQWLKTAVEPAGRRKADPLLEEIYQILLNGGQKPTNDHKATERNGTPYLLAMQRTACKVGKMLFRELVKEVTGAEPGEDGAEPRTIEEEPGEGAYEEPL